MRTVLATVVAVVTSAVAGCASADGTGSAGAEVVVTTSILGDVVANLVGDEVEVEVIMPNGANPHDFAPSARQAAAMRAADVLVVNGGGFEAGLTDTIEAAESDGARVLTALDWIAPLSFGDADDDHALDPHFFTDPVRMSEVVAGLAEELAELVPGLDSPAFRDRVASYQEDLTQLDETVRSLLAGIPGERRILVTNHEVFGYFAQRYDFEVLGAVIPGGSTLAEPSAADLAQLADAIAAAGVPAIFAETSSPSRLAAALAAEGAPVEVVELYSESLGDAGDAGTYLDMVRTNAERIAAALG